MLKITTLLIVLLPTSLLAQPCVRNTSSLSFDGSSSYVSITNQNGLDLTTGVTVEAWVNAAAWGFNSAQGSIVCKHGWSAGEAGYVLRAGGNGELSFNIGALDPNGVPIGWQEVLSPSGALSLNQWYHVAGTYDGTAVQCYVNGNLVGTTLFTGSIRSSVAYPLAIGHLSDISIGQGRYWNGLMDEIRVWDHALTQTEIQNRMNDHLDPATVTGLVSYWRFNEETGTLAADMQGGNDGTTMNCTWSTSVPFNTVPDAPVISYANDTLTSSAPIANQWYLDGNLIAGATQNYYAPQVNGIYTVVVTNGMGCSATSNPFTVADVGVSEIQSSVSFTIFPNPVNEIAGLQICISNNPCTAMIEIIDPLGKIISTRRIFLSAAKNFVPVSTRELAAGMYIFRIHNAEGFIAQKSLLVNH